MVFNPDEFINQPVAESSPSGFDPDAFLKQEVSPEQQANAEEAKDVALQSKYGTPGQQAIAGAEAVGRSGTFGLSSLVEKKLGVNPEDIRGREEANPITSGVGTIAGLVNPAAPEGKLLSMVGEAVAPKVVGTGILSGMTHGAVKLATENALYQTGDETSKMLLEDPHQSVGSAITNVGLAAVLGGVTGGALGTVSPLWKATVGNKASQLASDFKSRLKEHLETPDQAAALTDELQQYHSGIKQAADEVYGPVGLKAQEISKLLPEEMTPKISKQVEEINSASTTALRDMADKSVPTRYMNKFTNDLNEFQKIVTEPKSTPEQVFNATQDLKQTLQGYSKGNYGPFAVPSYHEAYDFLNITKNLGRDIRTSLEDPSVWGKAAERQMSINGAFKEYLPTLKDFEKKFTTEVAGERVIDPGKVNTYLNQLGKPNAELKQTMLKNFIDASEKYKQVLSDTHANLGVESPIPVTSTNIMRNTLKDQSHGSQLADLFVKHSSGIAGKTLGGALGGGIGLLSHIPGAGMVGTLIGEHALGPLFKSVIPAIAKPLLEKSGSGEGLKAATEYGINVAKGQRLADAASKRIFSGGDIVPESKQPSKETRAKIDAALNSLQQDPIKLSNTGGQIGHYMPNHAVAIGSMASNVVNFLNSIRPQNIPKAPLDPPRPVSQAIQSQYNRVLDIAQQPLIVLESVKNGTLTSHDIIAIQSLYPDLYKGLQQKIMSQMVEHVSKGESIPYNTRLGLSLFLGQPLDSTMKPEAIMAAQPMPEQMPQNPQQTTKGGKMPQSAGSNLLKGTKTQQTALQASESMHSTGKA